MKVRATLIALILLAVAARLLADWYVDASHQPRNENGQIAMHLAAGQGFSYNEFQYVGPTSIRPPVYPVLLATLAKLSRSDAYWASVGALMINTLAAAIAVPLAFTLGRRLRNERVGLTFAALVAIWPTQIYAATFVQGLSIGVTFSLATLVTVWRLRESPDRLVLAIVSGLFASLAVLAEASLTPPLALVTVCALIRRPQALVAMATVVFVVVGPWVYRNTLVHGHVTGITNTFGRDLYAGNGDAATGSLHQRRINFAGRPTTRLEQLSPQDADTLRRKPEAVRNQWMAEKAFAWIAAHPAEYARLCGVRLAKTLWLDWHHPQAFRVLNVVSRSIALIGLIAAVATRRRTGLPLLWCIGVVLASVLTVAESRSAALMDVGQLLALAFLTDKETKA